MNQDSGISVSCVYITYHKLCNFYFKTESFVCIRKRYLIMECNWLLMYNYSMKSTHAVICISYNTGKTVLPDIHMMWHTKASVYI